jgi:predicted nuclease of predicted toxin-antitoxin system
MSDSSGLEPLLVRLYFDRHIIKQLAVDLRGRGFDVLTTEEAHLESAPDDEQLAFAASQNRAIFTFNIRDFAPLHERWLSENRTHTGIIVSQQFGRRQYGVLLERMQRLLDHFSGDDLRNDFVHLEQFK